MPRGREHRLNTRRGKEPMLRLSHGRHCLAAAISLCGILIAFGAVARAAVGPPEKSRLTVGLSVPSLFYLPAYIAPEHTGREEGLQLDLVSFRGGSQVAAALASGSVDLAMASLNVVVNMISAGQPVRTVCMVWSRPAYEWFARSGIRGWPESRFLDRRFIDTFEEWAPR